MEDCQSSQPRSSTHAKLERSTLVARSSLVPSARPGVAEYIYYKGVNKYKAP